MPFVEKESDVAELGDVGEARDPAADPAAVDAPLTFAAAKNKFHQRGRKISYSVLCARDDGKTE